ncbi:SMI1/KNR4 family protein [Crossiella sp. SN42]|uniref:SMI1/KNR4 family protein n=1 Tax=Crossiella sp. SN42 TaxID=2944808 RepID=UPI00207D10CD|nr:SMI1/KNR4 family protein [Crossiella sp. SN42]MCO1577211.1 SMI1/KNR4 family protein [Crossiella sp. SN42]
MSSAADVDVLVTLMPPPPTGGPPIDWAEIARSWQRPFPPDYRRFIQVYGAGTVEDFLEVVPPQPKAPLHEAGWDGMVHETGNAEDTWEMAFKSAELAGTSPSLIAWAASSGADMFCWDATATDPAEWPVLVFDRGEGKFSRYDCGMAEFLTRMLRGDFPTSPLDGNTVLWGRGAATWKQL